VSSRNYGGLGLGLFIVRKIVNALGGTVSVSSQPQQGSTFVVEMPCSPMPTAASINRGGRT
ncbi:MAG: sensor histidine kinase, partial [Myxococcaceae bacterium]